MNEFPLSFQLRKGEDVPYRETLDEDGYSYELLINYRDKKGLLFICEYGVHVEWEEVLGWTRSNLIPERLFGKSEKLNEDQLKQILKTMINTGFEGFSYDQKTINQMTQGLLDSNHQPLNFPLNIYKIQDF